MAFGNCIYQITRLPNYQILSFGVRHELKHRAEPRRLGARFCAGLRSRLRHQPTLASCRSGGHAIWWTVEAASEQDALALLPFFVAKRTTATSVSEVEIP